MTIVYACSSNPGKLHEFNLVATELGASTIALVPLPGIEKITPPDETGATFEANASAKAQYYSQYTSEIVLADDSGLEVNALHGAPGVHSARYATPFREPRHAQDVANNALLLSNMEHVTDRTARFVCVITLAQQGRVLQTFHGFVEGQLLQSQKGSSGFGYDPLFFYPPFGCSFAELDSARKFSVSHRGSALRQVVAWFCKQPKLSSQP